MSCDVGEELCSFSKLSVTSPMSQLILQPFHHCTYVTTHSPTLLLLHLCHSSFSNPSVASPTSQLILQPFFCFSYVTGFSLTVIWRAAHGVLFTDEACFARERIYNSCNSHVWSMENPHATIVRSHQHWFCVNVWVGIVDDFLLDPYILPEWLNANTYLIFFQNVLPELLHPIPLNIRCSMRFHRDGHHLTLGMQYMAIWQLHSGSLDR